MGRRLRQDGRRFERLHAARRASREGECHPCDRRSALPGCRSAGARESVAATLDRMHFRRAAVLVALWLAVTLPAFAQSVRLEELTSPELRDRIAAGATTVLIPIGGTEQNAPHMVPGQ